MTKLNYPGPYELRLFYTTTPAGLLPIQHQAKYNIDLTAVPAPGTDFASLTIKIRNGAPNEVLSNYVDDWADLFRAVLSTAANNTVDFCELWSYEPLTNDASFVSVYEIALAGTTGLAAGGGTENILTFRTIEGGIMRMHFEEGAGFVGAVSEPPPYSVASLEAIRAFVVSGLNGFLGRDTSYPFAGLKRHPGQNEALFKKRFRD